MPKKGKGKNKDDGLRAGPKQQPRSHRNESPEGGEADDNQSETASVATHVSLDEDETESTATGEEITEEQRDLLEEKLKESIENSTHKNTNIRLGALQHMTNALTRCYIPGFLDEWKVTMVDSLEKNVKRGGTTAEAALALRLVALLANQLGLDAADGLAKIIVTLRALMLDVSLPIKFRAECAAVLGVTSFLVEDPENMTLTTTAMYTAWTSVKSASCSQEQIPLFSACHTSWVFLLLQQATAKFYTAIDSDLPKIVAYLECPHVDIRVTAGESLAVIYESANEVMNDFKPPLHQHILGLLEGLATESVKYRAKRERRLQRASFRDILSAVKEGSAPELTVKFGEEKLVLDSWNSKLCYDVFCHVLAAGMNSHLKTNELLRNLFNLGRPLAADFKAQKLSKSERQALNDTVSKARTLMRGKQRDKRLANFSS